MVPSISGSRSRWTPSRGDVAAAEAAFAGAGADLVDLVEKDDAVVFRVVHRFLGEAIGIDQLVGLLALQDGAGGRHFQFFLRLLAAHHAAHHFAEVDHLAGRYAWQIDLADRRRPSVGHGDFDVLVFHLAVTEHFSEFVLGVGAGGVADQRIDDAVFSTCFGLGLHVPPAGFAQHVEADFDQIAHDGIDVAADIADFGEFGGFHLEKRRLGEAGQPAGDFGLAAAGGADHQDVFRHHFVAQGFWQLGAAPAIAECYGHRAFGVGLAHDEAIELAHDFAGGEGGGVHHSVSISSEWLV